MRRFSIDDVARIAALDGDPDVTRYVADGLPRARAGAEDAVSRALRKLGLEYRGIGHYCGREASCYVIERETFLAA